MRIFGRCRITRLNVISEGAGRDAGLLKRSTGLRQCAASLSGFLHHLGELVQVDASFTVVVKVLYHALDFFV